MAGRPNAVTAADYVRAAFAQQGALWRQWARSAGDGQPRWLIVLDQDDDAHVEPEQHLSVAPWVDARTRLVTGTITLGLTGYVAGSDVHLVDRHGLAEPITSRLVLDHRGRPGHEKWLPNAWIVGRYSTAISDDPQVASARRALACGDLAALHQALTEPMTASRFLANVQLAWRLTSLRIPVRPDEAAHRFCG
jgi:arabinofuranosyltransferase